MIKLNLLLDFNVKKRILSLFDYISTDVKRRTKRMYTSKKGTPQMKVSLIFTSRNNGPYFTYDDSP